MRGTGHDVAQGGWRKRALDRSEFPGVQAHGRMN